jgi:cell division protein FtsI/penicillin-binding protein 2
MAEQRHMKHNMWRANFWYGFVIVVFAFCLARLFYIQILQHGHYSSAALSDQYKEYQIPAARGVIRAQDGDRVVPIVLSQTLYTIYADPEMIKDVAKTAETTANEIGGDAKTYAELMSGEGRYVVLAKKVSAEARDKLLKHEMPGIGSQSQSYRTYPQGTLAANLLGFVDDEGVGRYGIEQALQNELAGTAGQLKAVTDINGVPLAASEDNVRVPAVAGDDVVLTIDIGMQKQAEQLLKQGLDRAQSERGSVVIMEAKTGAVKAMANYPSYDPANYGNVDDAPVLSDKFRICAILLTPAPPSSSTLVTTRSSICMRRAS